MYRTVGWHGKKERYVDGGTGNGCMIPWVDSIIIASNRPSMGKEVETTG